MMAEKGGADGFWSSLACGWESTHSAIDILISWDNFIVTIQNGARGARVAGAETLFQSDCYTYIPIPYLCKRRKGKYYNKK